MVHEQVPLHSPAQRRRRGGGHSHPAPLLPHFSGRGRIRSLSDPRQYATINSPPTRRCSSRTPTPAGHPSPLQWAFAQAPARDAKLDGTNRQQKHRSGDRRLSAKAFVAAWTPAAKFRKNSGCALALAGVPARPLSRGRFHFPSRTSFAHPRSGTGKTALGGTSFRGERLDTASGGTTTPPTCGRFLGHARLQYRACGHDG